MQQQNYCITLYCCCFWMLLRVGHFHSFPCLLQRRRIATFAFERRPGTGIFRRSQTKFLTSLLLLLLLLFLIYLFKQKHSSKALKMRVKLENNRELPALQLSSSLQRQAANAKWWQPTVSCVPLQVCVCLLCV